MRNEAAVAPKPDGDEQGSTCPKNLNFQFFGYDADAPPSGSALAGLDCGYKSSRPLERTTELRSALRCHRPRCESSTNRGSLPAHLPRIEENPSDLLVSC